MRFDAIAFLRAGSWRPGVLCAEPILARLAQVGITPAFTPEDLRTLWTREGVLPAARRIAAELGLCETQAPRPGDPVVIDLPDTGPALAIWAGGGFAALITPEARPGAVKTSPLAAWCLPCPR